MSNDLIKALARKFQVKKLNYKGDFAREIAERMRSREVKT